MAGGWVWGWGWGWGWIRGRHTHCRTFAPEDRKEGRKLYRLIDAKDAHTPHTLWHSARHAYKVSQRSDFKRGLRGAPFPAISPIRGPQKFLPTLTIDHQIHYVSFRTYVWCVVSSFVHLSSAKSQGCFLGDIWGVYLGVSNICAWPMQRPHRKSQIRVAKIMFRHGEKIT